MCPLGVFGHICCLTVATAKTFTSLALCEQLVHLCVLHATVGSQINTKEGLAGWFRSLQCELHFGLTFRAHLVKFLQCVLVFAAHNILTFVQIEVELPLTTAGLLAAPKFSPARRARPIWSSVSSHWTRHALRSIAFRRGAH